MGNAVQQLTVTPSALALHQQMMMMQQQMQVSSAGICGRAAGGGGHGCSAVPLRALRLEELHGMVASRC
jgi:hypothetical protein